MPSTIKTQKNTVASQIINLRETSEQFRVALSNNQFAINYINNGLELT